MIIKQVEIQNYKSFRSPQKFSLGPGFNVIIGSNNAGKSALVEAMTLNFQHKPHSSTAISQFRTAPNLDPSVVLITVLINPQDVTQYQLEHRLALWTYQWFPHLDPNYPGEQINGRLASGGIEMEVLLRQPGGVELRPDPVTKAINGELRAGLMSWDIESSQFVNFRTSHIDPSAISLSQAVYNMVVPKIYAFRAERLGIGTHTIGPQAELATNGSNLPMVLNHLQTANPDRFRTYVRLVQRVLPDIQDVTVPPANSGGGQVEIRIWNEPSSTQRDDLSVPLTDCGTGVSQVLAMLYIVVTSDQPRTLVIDEPQSFLNPGALRKFLEILGEYPQHQYVLATHSPTLLTALELSSLTLVKRQGTESAITGLDPKAASELKLALNEVGAQLSDVYGADRVLWVEGPTEEACFPSILKAALNRPLDGTVVLGVKHTGDFESKKGQKARLAFEVYAKLSLRKPLLPPALGFVFDREGRSKADCEDLEREGKAVGVPVHFLKRRLFENYLLEPRVIAQVLNTHDTNRETPIAVEDVQAWIEEHQWDVSYFERQVPEAQRDEKRWLLDVHGAKLLDTLFKDLAETRVEYRKTVHSVEITELLLQEMPEQFVEIVSILKELLETPAG